MSALLGIEKLELAYGQVAVCRDISLRLDRGEIVALIGANGAGKSTTLRAIAGVLPPRQGTIVFAGRDVTHLPSYERSKLGIALVPEGRHVFPFLTVRENLELGGFNVRKDAAKIRQRMDSVFAMFPRLSERSSQNAGQQRLTRAHSRLVSRGESAAKSIYATWPISRVSSADARPLPRINCGTRSLAA